MTDRERKAALEALSTSYTSTDQTGYPDTIRLYMPREDYMTIRAALTLSPMDEDVREAVEWAQKFMDGDTCLHSGELETLIRAASAQTASPYKDYTWEDVAMLVQENRALKEAATAQKCEWQPIETAPLNFEECGQYRYKHPTKGETE